MKVGVLFCRKTAFQNEDLEKTGWVRREMTSSVLGWLRLEAVEKCREILVPGVGGKRREKKWKGAIPADGVDGAYCAEIDGAVVVMVKVLVEERDVTKTCVGEG